MKNISFSVNKPTVNNTVEELDDELEYMKEVEMPRWAYTSGEWNERIMKIMRLRKLRQKLRED